MYCLISARSTNAKSNKKHLEPEIPEMLTDCSGDIGRGEYHNIIKVLQLVYLGEQSIHDLQKNQL